MMKALLALVLLLPVVAQSQGLTWPEAQEAYDKLPSNMNLNFATQCGDRAHVWSYLLQSKMKIPSQKVFLYFTPKSFNYTGMLWGFHVATVIKVEGEDYVIEKIPRYELTGRSFVLRDELLFDSPITMKDWLVSHTGFESCKELDMNNPADKQAFKHFKTIKVYKSPENCVLAKTPSVYWWPNSVYNTIYKNHRLKDPIDPTTAMMACSNIHSVVECNELLKP